MNVLDFTDDAIEGFSERLLSRVIVEPADEDGAVLVRPHRVLVEVRPPYIQSLSRVSTFVLFSGEWLDGVLLQGWLVGFHNCQAAARRGGKLLPIWL